MMNTQRLEKVFKENGNRGTRADDYFNPYAIY